MNAAARQRTGDSSTGEDGEPDRLVTLSTYTTAELFRRLKVQAAKTGRKQHVIVTDALREYLERNGG